ncbi:hypothetical protein POTOM_050212 [Populus tomentosa]|uniref:N-acetylglucosaminylphosphatidylinositol deacetylase n=1 Tax=Populus tomentosa TaxID=118781 RepID=A0A8X7Y7Q4_POPTO|nr:hypothetical protein POTOM_050212 [Populus tomentosa]
MLVVVYDESDLLLFTKSAIFPSPQHFAVDLLIFGCPLSMLLPMKYTDGMMHCQLNEHPQKSFHAMAEHSSQWVWFRKLFVSLSSYTYVNTLRKITNENDMSSIDFQYTFFRHLL